MKDKTKKQRSGWRIIFAYLGEYKRDIVILSFLGVISAFANGTVPYIIGRFFDSILLPNRIFLGQLYEMPIWLALLILWGTVQMVANLTDWVNDVKGRRIGIKAHGEYFTRAVAHLINLPISFHKNFKVGGVWDKIQRAQQAISTILERVVITLAPQILSVVVGFIVAFWIKPILGGILVLGVIVYVISLSKLVPPIVSLQRKTHQAWSKAYGDAYESLHNVYDVKRSTSEGYESRKTRKNFLEVVLPQWMRVERIWSGISFYQRIVITITQLVIFIFSVFYIQEGSLTIGELLALNGYAAMVFGPFVILGINWELIQNGVVSVERADKILSEPTEIYEPEGAVQLSSIKGGVEFKNVYFSYDSSESNVLKGVNFEVKSGEVVAFVGESGVGKSTTIDLISGYYFPNKGKVLIDGHDIKLLGLKFLRQQIAVVPQEVVLFNDTVKENICYGSFGANEKAIKQAAHEAYADVFIDKFPKGYKQVVGERGVKLSVGQKQRIAIARAVLRDPKILILDEPTSALDVQTETYINESLQRLMQGRTTFIIAHRLSTVRRADKILVFEKGRIVEQGTHSELIKKKDGVYQHLYNLHIGLQ